jgi:hypothetical protein
MLEMSLTERYLVTDLGKVASTRRPRCVKSSDTGLRVSCSSLLGCDFIPTMKLREAVTFWICGMKKHVSINHLSRQFLRMSQLSTDSLKIRFVREMSGIARERLD